MLLVQVYKKTSEYLVLKLVIFVIPKLPKPTFIYRYERTHLLFISCKTMEFEIVNEEDGFIFSEKIDSTS